MSDSKCTITIAITCYNAVETIACALDCAKSITGNILEILVHDDCSTDGSANVIEKHRRNNPKIRVLRPPTNVGVGCARAALIAEAKSEFLLFLDDDDVSLTHRAERQIAKILEIEATTGNTLVACYASGERHYRSGYTMPLPAIATQSPTFGGESLAAYLLYFERERNFHYGSGTPTCSLAARVRTFRQVGSFDPKFRRLEDVDFAIRLGLAGGLVCGTTDVCYIQHSTSGADKAPENNLANEIRLATKHQDFLKSKGMYFYAKNWPRLRYYHFKRRYIDLLWTLFLLVCRYPNRATKHFLTTAPKRLKHERKIAAGR